MGIYDREYYRDDSRGPGFFSGAAPACKAIILVNAALFLVLALFKGPERLGGPEQPLIQRLALHSGDIFAHFEIYRPITAAFLHDRLLSLIFPMLFLWMAGREMEILYQGREFTAFYLTAAALASLTWAVADATLGGGPRTWYGAIGAVSAVFVLFALHYPHREVMLFGVIRLEVRMLLMLYLGLTVLIAYNETRGGPDLGTELAPFVGGAGYAWLYKTLDLRWSRLLGKARRRGPSLRVYAPEPRDKVAPLSSSGQARPAGPSGSRPMSGVTVAEEQLDDRLDEVLAKIAREGRGGLSDEENRILQEASQRARNRRSDRL